MVTSDMRDFYFSVGMTSFLIVVVALYCVRLLRRGRARHTRLEEHGGSVFLNKGSMEVGYWILDPLAGWLARRRITPNMVTGFSLIPGLSAGISAGFGWFGLTCLLGTVAAFSDIIDGVLARKLGIASEAGETFDAAADRYMESALLAGLAIHYRSDALLLGLTLAALIGSFMVSYTTAKAEAAHVKPPRGSMRRAERAVYLLFAADLTGLTAALLSDSSLFVRELPILIAITLVGVATNVSAVRRFASLAGTLRDRELAASQHNVDTDRVVVR